MNPIPKRTKIGIVLPVLNAVDTVEQTLFSLFSQSSDVELHLHIQDGQSSDGTIELIKKWQKLWRSGDFPAKDKIALHSFSLTCEADTGMYDALSKGFSTLMKNLDDDDMMSWINADDVFIPSALVAVASFIQQHPNIQWITGCGTSATLNGGITYFRSLSGYPQDYLRLGLYDGENIFHVQAEGTFFHKKLYQQAGGFDTKYRLAGDFDLWRRFAEISPLVVLSEGIAMFRYRTGQLSSDIDSYSLETKKSYKVVIEERNKLLSTIKRNSINTMIGNKLPPQACQVAIRNREDRIWIIEDRFFPQKNLPLYKRIAIHIIRITGRLILCLKPRKYYN